MNRVEEREREGADVLRLVLVDKLEELSGSVLVKGVRELGDGRGNLRKEKRGSTDQRESGVKQGKEMTYLQPLVEDNLLPLESDVLGPLDESREVGLGGKVTS
jgi:hypothetical protein